MSSAEPGNDSSEVANAFVPQRTFLFTDIERSIQAWEADPDVMLSTLDAQQEILVRAASRYSGSFIGDGGDGWNLVFDEPVDAVLAGVEAQRAFERLKQGGAGKVRVRIGIHTGTPVFSSAGDLRGPPLNVAGRLHKAAHGGQIVVSEAARAAVVDSLPPSIRLVSIGEHHLRDLAPADYYQVHASGLPSRFPPLVATVSMSGRLAVPAGRLIGRGTELAQLRFECQPGLLTITGLGGIGKTRLALTLVGEVVAQYPDGVRSCDLSVTEDDSAVSEVVASSLGIEPGSSAVGRVADSLAPKQMILLLDNCEHVRRGAAEVASAVVSTCPHVLVLATSRIPLGVSAEREWLLGSLAVDTSAEDGGHPPAVDLFLERARESSPGWEPSDEDLDAVSAICGSSDGLPLAIELAAAQIKYLGAVDLAAQLGDDRTPLLSSSDPAERTSLWAVLEWSFQRLDPHSQDILQQLVGFSGGFTLGAAEAIVQVRGSARTLLSCLAELVDRSLIQVDRTSSSGTRYHLLETVRAFCRARTPESVSSAHRANKNDQDDLFAQLELRHARYYVELAELMMPRMRTEEEPVTVFRINSEFANFRVAHATAVAKRDFRLAARLVCALSDFCFVRLRYELYAWADRTLQLNAVPDELLPDVYGIAATGAFLRGDLAESERLARLGLDAEVAGTESFHVRFILTVSTGYSDRPVEAEEWVKASLDWCNERSNSYYRTVTLVASAIGLSIHGDRELARVVADMALDEATLSGNPTCISYAMYARAEALRSSAPQVAAELLAASLEIAGRIDGEFMIGFSLGVQAAIYRKAGKLLAAADAVLRLLDHWSRAGHLPQQWLSLREAELVLAACGRFEASAMIGGALPRGIVLPPTEEDQAEIDANDAMIEEALGRQRRLTVAASGAAISVAEVTRFARAELREVLA